MSILKTECLTYTYAPGTPFKHTAVNNISFSVEKGEITGIIGHTGSGKSTLLQLLNGLLKPTGGKVYFEDKDIWEDPKNIGSYRYKIGLVFQYPEYQLFEETVKEDIAYGPKNMKLSAEEIEKRVNEAIEIVGLKEHLLDKSPFDLSGGEKRRAAIAGILSMKPEIIIFDEPTAGLDPVGRETVFEAIKKYRHDNNATVIIVSHSMEDMASICDKIIVLNDGNVVMHDNVANVFKNAKKLKEIGLNVPLVTDVFLTLKDMGVDISTEFFTVDSAAEYLISKIKGGNCLD